jgi:mannitol operon repressor
MPNEVTKQIPDEAFENLTELFRVTKTPGQRLVAFTLLHTQALRIIRKFLEDGKITSAAAARLVELSKGFAQSPPSNFIDMLARLYAFFEQAMMDVGISDTQRATISKFLPYLHQMAFSPPENSPIGGAKQQADDLSDFAAFVNEFEKETDRGAALVGAALVDSRLERLLRGHFLNEVMAAKLLSDCAGSPLAVFSARIKMCYALGLIAEPEYDECEIIRRVRNKFAHRLHGLTFDDQQVAGWCGNLKAMTFLQGRARQRFIHSVITLCMVLWYRPAHAAPFRAQDRKWPWHL